MGGRKGGKRASGSRRKRGASVGRDVRRSKPASTAGSADEIRIEAATFRRGMGIVLGSAALIRAVYLLETLSIPLYKDFLLLDSKHYKAMAQSIAGGDWIAGTEAYTLGPFYAYFLGLLDVFFGGDTIVVFVAQQLLGLASVGLTGWLAFRCFGARAAIVATALMALYAPVALMELKVMASTTALFLGLLGVALLIRSREAGWVGLAFLPGVIFGMACLSRPNTLLLCPVVVAWLAWPSRSNIVDGRWIDPRRFAAAGFLAVGIAAAIAPATLRNLKVEGEPILISSQGGITFYQANNPRSQGTYVAIPGFTGSQKTQSQEARSIAEGETGHPLSTTEVSNFWFRKGLQHILNDPLWAIQLSLEKLTYWTGSQEFSTEYVLLTERKITRSLWLMPLPFAVLLGLATIGVRVRPFNADTWLLAIFILANLASAMMFYFSSRYRLPAIPFLCVFAGAGAAFLVERWRANEAMGRWVRIALPGGIVFLLSIIPWHADYEMQAANQFSNIGNEYFYAEEYDKAVSFYRRALERLDGKAKIHNNLGVTYKVLERWPEAAREFERALQLAPDNDNAKRHLQEIRLRAAAKPDSDGADE